MSLIKREHRTSWPWETGWPQDVVDGTFRDMLRAFFDDDGPRAFAAMSHPLRVEEFLDGEDLVIRAELPGIDPEKDVEVTLEDGILHLRAEREEHSREERPEGFRSEFHYGTLSRSIRMPEGTTDADVRATYSDGILEVRVPAPRETAAPEKRSIPITRG